MTGQLHRLAATAPMEAKLLESLPTETGWLYEPKWDGFRAIASRSGDRIALMSKSGKSLARFFPEIIATLAHTSATDYVIDGELILPIGKILSFDALQARLHPAPSRIEKLSRETPAQLMLFDCLALDGEALIDRSLRERRRSVEAFHKREGNKTLLLSPCTRDPVQARTWLEASGGALDGVIAKPLDAPYHPGERAMRKVKQHRSADCVVGGFRRAKDGPEVASLLLGLYDEEGLLHHVGFTSALGREDKAALTQRLEALIAAPGFTGKAPGGPSRWTRDRDNDWFPLEAELVVEISYDQVTGDRLRHGARLLRWRPDKAPHQCTMDQLQYELRPSQLPEIG